MSLTIDNNRLAQQQALPAQLTAAQTNTAATTAPTATTATASPSAQLISGNAGLTSDLLSVLLQDQSGASTGFGTDGTDGTSSGPVTLAGVLDAEDQMQADQSQSDSFTGLDPASAAQSATSTDTFASGLQDLLDRLAQMPV